VKRLLFILALVTAGISSGSSPGDDPSGKADSIRKSLEPNAIIAESQGEMPRVVIVQDIHAQPDAQLKIESILASLETSLGPLSVLLEGGAGPLDGSFFKSFPLPEVSREILLQYVDRGELSGAELAAATHDVRSYYEGMEDWALYEKNREAMREGSRIAERLDAEYTEEARKLAAADKKDLPEKITEWEKQETDYQAGKLDAVDYARSLKDIYDEPPVTKPFSEAYPTLSGLIRIKMLWTPELDDRAEDEKRGLKGSLEEFYGVAPEDISDEALVEGARYARIPSSRYSNLAKRSEMKKEIRDIESLGFIGELEALEAEIPGKLLKTKAAKEAFQRLRRIQLLTKLVNFELSRTEYVELLGDDLTGDPRLKPFIDFYRLAIEREAVFMKKAEMALKGTAPVVIVVGGFHSSGLEAKLRKDKVPYLSLMPKTQALETSGLYRKLMIGDQYSYLAVRPEPHGALALATVLTYLSNPGSFKRFVNLTGEEMYDRLRFYEVGEDAYDLSALWADSLMASEKDPALQKEYQTILTRLYLRTLKFAGYPKTASDQKKYLRNVNAMMGRFFLENGNVPISREKLDRFLTGLRAAALKPDIHLLDLIFLVYGSKWDLSQEEVEDRYRKFLRFEPLPPGISDADYHRLNEAVFDYTLPQSKSGYQLANLGRILESKVGGKLKDFLAADPIDDLLSWQAGFLTYVRRRPYSPDTPLSAIHQDAIREVDLEPDSFRNDYGPGVPKEELYIAPGGMEYLLVKPPYPPALQPMVNKAFAEIRKIEKDLKQKYISPPPPSAEFTALQYNLGIVSDSSYKIRRSPAAVAFVDRRLAKDDPRMMTGRGTVYLAKELLERLGELSLADPELGREITDRVLRGYLREELEGHIFPLGVYSPRLGQPDELRERVDRLFGPRGFDRQAVEQELRMSRLPRESPRYILDEEALAKFMRGGGNTEELIRHLAAEQFINYGFPFGYSREYFRGEIKNFFRMNYDEFVWIRLKLLPEETRGYLRPYEGKTFFEAVEGEALKYFDRWQKSQGQSLGKGDDNILPRIERILEDKTPAYGDLNDLLERIRHGAFKGKGIDRIDTAALLDRWQKGEIGLSDLESKLQIPLDRKDEFRAVLAGSFPEHLRWDVERERFAQEQAVLRQFLGTHSDLDPAVLAKTPLSKMLADYQAIATKPSTVHFLPQAVPSSENEILRTAALTVRQQTVYLYSLERDILRKDNPGELIGKAKTSQLNNSSLHDALQRFEVVRVPKRPDLPRALAQKLRNPAQEGWRASLFARRDVDPRDLPPAEKNLYVLLNTANDFQAFPWLNEKVEEIGFILPAISEEEAQKLRRDLTGYGFGFRETEKGLFVWIEDIGRLLTRLGDEYKALQLQAKAA